MQVLRKTKWVGSRRIVWGMALVGALAMVGCSSSTSPSTEGVATAAPVFSPIGGSYNTAQTVTVSDATPGAVLYCTTDGTAPTTSSPKCAQSIAVSQSEFVQALAVAPDMPASPIAAASYVINPNAAASPTFSPAGGTYNATQTVTLADTTKNATIFYTTDGSTPTTASMQYIGPISISKSQTISAIATAPGFSNSAVASAAYTIAPAITATPTFSPAAGTFTMAQTVALSDATPDAVIYYTLDGSQPSTSSTIYTGAITVSATETINAIAVAPGASSSPMVSATYIITAPAAPPTFTPVTGTYTSVQDVEIDDATPGATIYYTTNGSTPTISSMQYAGKISVATSETIMAIAMAPNYTNSSVASAAYTINLPGTPAPMITPDSGSYNSAQTVTITDSDKSATIYYTTDGTPASSSSTPYTAPFQMSKSGTISAIAIDPSAGANSPVVTKTYTITIGGSALNGTVLSGTKPVSGAQVQLYAAGTSGYGAGATVIGGPAGTDNSGAFSLFYSCPAAPGDQVYLVATGGDTGHGNNPGAVLMSVLGSCGKLGTSATAALNEVTTVAAAYSLAQFAASNTSGAGITVGTSSTNAIGLSNAMKTPDNLVDATGTALTITPFYKAAGGTSGGILNSSYVPQARINTLADVLSACVESDGTISACSSLYSAATPTGGNSPIDTLQAILSIAQHPGSNVGTVYGLYASSQPFQPALTSVPNDWTMALTFTGGGLGPIPGVEPGYGSPEILNMSLDAQGNVWMLASTGCFDPGSFNSNYELLEFDSQGNALSPAATASNSYCGGLQPQFNGSPVLSGGGGLAVDLNGFIWAGGNQQIAKISSDGTAKQADYSMFSGGEGPCYPNDIAVDASNNIWTGCAGEFNNGFFAENSGTDGSVIGGQQLDNGSAINNISSISLDLFGNVWGVPAPFTNPSNYSNLYQISAIDGQLTFLNDHSTSGATFTTSVIADGVGNVFSVSTTPGILNALASDGTTLTSLSYPMPSGATGMEHLALDGAGNIWGSVYSGPSFAAAPIPSYLVEMTPSGTTLSPTGTNTYGYSGAGGGGETQPIVSDVNPNSTGTAAVAVDSSGNIWVANQTLPGTYIPNTPPIGEQLVEFIGIAPPVVMPTAQQLVLNKVGVRP